jgi:outer membrane protein TolC
MKTISLSILALATTANAQLSQIEQRALQTHPMIAAAEAEARALRARGDIAKAPFKPMISLTGVGALGDDAAIFASSVEPRNYLMAVPDPVGIGSLMAMWTIYSGGRDRSAAAYSSALVAEGDARIAVARLDVVRDVRVAFAELLAARGELEAATAGFMSAEELLRVTEQMFEAGSAPEAFVLKARASLEQARRKRSMAEAEVRTAEAMLRESAAATGDLILETATWDIDLSAPETLEEALRQAESRPELRATDARRAAAASRSRAARQSAYPELNLVGMGTGMATESESDVFYKVGLVLSVPITDGGMRRAESAEMAAMANVAEQEARAIRLRVTREVTSAWAQWQASPETLRASEAEVVSAQEAYRIARLRYQEGKAPQVEVEQAAADLVEALAGRAEANAFRRIAWANLMRAVGIQNDQEDQKI